MFKQLTEQDAGYLYLETPETPQHVGGMSLVELPAGYEGDFYEDYKKHIGSRLHLVPMLHQKLVRLPLDIDHPFWANDDQVDLDYHIRHQTVPRPGRMSQLEELVGRLHSNFLDRSRPLWEFYVIDGLESGQVAIYTKIHHAAMDGASSQLLVETMYDPTPVPRQLPPPQQAAEKTQAKLEDMVRGVAGHIARQEIRALQYLPELLKTWSHLVLPDARTLSYDKPVLPPLRPPKTPFNVGITSQRMYAVRTLPLPAFKRIAKQAGAKLNDVVLAVCAGALRRYLEDKGALPRQAMTAMVPVSLRGPGDGPVANQNALFLCSLATDLADPWQRLLAIRESSAEQKQLLGSLKDALLPDMSIPGGGMLVRNLVDLAQRAGLAERLPPLYNLVVSNVAGPPVPLYIAGARLLSFYPCSIPFHGMALNITCESYCDALDFGLIACRRTVPDLAELADGLGESLAELVQSAAEQAAPPAPPPVESAPARPARARAAAAAAPASPARSRSRRARPAASTPTGENEVTP